MPEQGSKLFKGIQKITHPLWVTTALAGLQAHIGFIGRQQPKCPLTEEQIFFKCSMDMQWNIIRA